MGLIPVSGGAYAQRRVFHHIDCSFECRGVVSSDSHGGGGEDALLRRSRDFLGHQQTKLESLIAELEASSQRYKKDLESLLTEKQKLDELVKEYE